MTDSPPLRKDVSLTRSPPFLVVEERREQRDEHAQMAVFMALATVLGLALVGVPAALPAATALVAGYALHAWLVYDDLYAEVDG